jgi:hypothetical protein
MAKAALDASPGDDQLVERELVGAGHGDVRPLRCTVTPAAAEHALGVVAAGAGLGDRGGAVGGQGGQQHARLYLRAGHRQLVVDRAQLRAVDGERRRRPSVASTLRAHQAQRLGDAVDRPRRIEASPSSV